jgi:outer membrane scaffolding protein for murein synthesis (MipA/OmpV family)
MKPAMKHQARHARALCAAAAAALAGLADAAQAELPLWELGAGLGALSLPHYRGSDQSRSWLLPLPYFVYRGEFLRADREGAHAQLVDSQRVDLDLSLDVSTPARSNDNRARAGMPNLQAAFEVGPNLNIRLAGGAGWKLDLRLPVRAVTTVGSHAQGIGWRSNPALAWDATQQGWDISTQLGPVWGSRRYHAYFYDVAPAYATATRPLYSSPSGFGGWTWSATASHRFGDWWLGTYLQADSLRGAAFNGSPLVRTHSNLSLGVGLSRVFAVSEARAYKSP